MVRLILIVWMFLGTAAQAELWVTAEGVAVIHSAGDTDSARRRAFADAIYGAVLGAGAQVRGHTAVSLGKVERDLTIVQSSGTVRDVRVLASFQQGDTWHVRLKAFIGRQHIDTCSVQKSLFIKVLPPDVRVSPYVPAWSVPLADDAVQRLYRRLTQGAVTADFTFADDRQSIAPGEIGVHPSVTLTSPDGQSLALQVELVIFGEHRRIIARSVFQSRADRLKVSVLGQLNALIQKSHDRMGQDLFNDYNAFLNKMYREQACAALTGRIKVLQNRIVVPLGSRHGIAASTIAITPEDAALFEISRIEPQAVHLLPLDPTLDVQAFDGRQVQFILMPEGTL